MQYPSEIPDHECRIFTCSQNAGKEEDEKISIRFPHQKLDEKDGIALNMKEEMAERYLNEGFSGMRKRNEILQLLMLKPNICPWDEITSGLNIDALLRSYLKGLMQCEVKVLELRSSPTTNVCWTILLLTSRDDGKAVSCFQWTELAARLEREGYATAEELGYDYKEEL